MFNFNSSLHPFIHSSVNRFIIQKGMTDILIHPSLHLCLASSFMCTFPSTSLIILEALNVTVGLQWGEEDVEEPQADEQHGGQNFWCPGPAQLSTDLWPPSVHQCGNTYKGKDGKECDGERQCAWIHLEITALGVMVDGGDGPCHLSDISKASQNYMKMTHRTLTITWQMWQWCRYLLQTHMLDSPRYPGIRLQHWIQSHYRWRRRRTDPGWQPPYWQKYLGRQRRGGHQVLPCSMDTSWKVLGNINRQCYISLMSAHVTDEEAASEPLFPALKPLMVYVKLIGHRATVQQPGEKYVTLGWMDGDDTWLNGSLQLHWCSIIISTQGDSFRLPRDCQTNVKNHQPALTTSLAQVYPPINMASLKKDDQQLPL